MWPLNLATFYRFVKDSLIFSRHNVLGTPWDYCQDAPNVFRPVTVSLLLPKSVILPVLPCRNRFILTYILLYTAIIIFLFMTLMNFDKKNFLE